MYDIEDKEVDAEVLLTKEYSEYRDNTQSAATMET